MKNKSSQLKKIAAFVVLVFLLSSAVGQNNALSFDGTSDYVTTSNAPSLTTNFSVCAWIKPNVITGIHAICGINNYWSFTMNTNKLRFTAYGAYDYDGTAIAFPTANVAYHVAFIKTGNSLSFYVNGNLLETVTVANPSAGSSIIIGSNKYSEYFNGAIDELSFWNTNISTATLTAAKNGILTGTETGLVAYYKFNQGMANGTNTAITTLTDTKAAYNGSLNTFALTGTTSNWVYGLGPGDINVRGNGVSILDGTNAPTTRNNTDFNAASATTSVTQTYTIQNLGSGNIDIAAGGISLNGANASDFSVGGITLPLSLTSGASTTFTVTYTPNTTFATPSSASVHIASNDFDEADYDFVITGEVTTPGLNFDGTNDYVGFYNPIIGSGNFTLEAWIKTPPTTVRRSIISMGKDVSGQGLYLYVGTTGKLQADLSYISGPISNSVVADDAWHHVAVTNTGGVFQLYIDGVADGNPLTMSAVNITNSTSYCSYIGVSYPASGILTYYYSGTMDEIRIWSNARTQSQLYNNMHVPIDPNSAGLVRYYGFNQPIPNGTNTGLTSAIDYTVNQSSAGLFNFDLTGSTSNWVNGIWMNTKDPNAVIPQQKGALIVDGILDNVSIGEPSLIDNSSFTMEVWCKVDAGTKNYLFSGGKATANYGIMAGYSEDGRFNFSLSGDEYYSAENERNKDFGKWNHWACVWTKTGDHAGTRTIYKNGQLLYGPSTVSTLNISAATSSSVYPLKISGFNGTDDYAFDGAITEFRLWTDALPADTIKRYYQSEVQKEGHGYWKTSNNKLLRYYQTIFNDKNYSFALKDETGNYDCTIANFAGQAFVSATEDRPVAPPIPYGTTLVNNCQNLKLSWRGDPDSPFYQIYNNNVYVTSTSDTSYVSPSIPGTTYNYSVKSARAYTGTDSTEASNYSLTVSGGLPVILAAPVNLVSDQTVCDGKVTLTWTISGTPPSYLELQRSNSLSFSTFTRVDTTINGTTTLYNDIPPSDGVWYYRMRSKNSCNAWGNFGLTVSGTHYTYPAAPTNLTANIVDNKINLSWTDNAVNETVYVIQRKAANESFQTLANDYPANSTSYIDAEFIQCNDYVYQVSASSTCGLTTSNITGTVNLTPNLSNVITSFTATKGEFSDKVVLQWTANDNGNPTLYDSYEIRRSTEGDTTFSNSVLIGTVTKGNTSLEITSSTSGFTNRTVMRYWIRAVTTCGGNPLYSNMKNDLGFSNPTASINGKITYFGSSQAVPNVILRTSGSTFDKSTYCASYNGTTSYTRVPRSIQDDFTIEYWVKTSQTSPTGTYWYSGKGIIDASDAATNTNDYGTSLLNGKLAFGVGNPSVTISSNTSINNGIWHHVAVTRKKSTGTIKIYIDGTLEKSGTANTNSLNAVSYIQLGSLANNTNFFNGKLDEVRFWDIEKDSISIKNDYNRMLSGKETDLVAYYRLDDNCISMIFDCSQSAIGEFHKNHSSWNVAASLTTDVPTISQLNFSGLSDLSGNYSIDKLPIQGSSENITVTPVYLTHQFNPQNQFLSINSTNTLNNINFQDSSVFLFTGKVVYGTSDSNNTACGVEGIQFSLDGLVQISNNTPIVSSSDGSFSLKVPLGQHTITASKMGHTFVNVCSRNFDAALSGYRFYDNTLITVIGSVVGGEVEGSKKLGFGKCVNNIGRAKIHFQSVSCDSYTKDVYTNPITGEYTVNLPPMEFQFGGPSNNPKGVVVESNYDVDFSNLTSSNLNLSNYLILNTTYDTVFTASHQVHHVDSVKYHLIRNFVYNAAPQISVTYKSDSLYHYKTSNDVDTTYTLNNLPLPAFSQNFAYALKVKAYETYINKDNTPNVSSVVPIKQAIIYIKNSVADLSMDSIVLNSVTGDTLITFRAGNPNIASPFTKTIELSLAKGSKTVVWPTLHAFVFGALPIVGSNFVTTGPDLPFTILRDPPGSNSYSYLDKETKISTTDTYTSTYQNANSEKVTVSLGTDLWIGFLVLSETEVKADLGIGAHETNTWVNGNSIRRDITLTQKWQTSDSPELPGAKSDIFIGGATNYIFGATDCVYPIMKSACITCYDTTNYSGFNVGKSNNLFMVPNGFATTFMYTQNHIENVVIPNLINLRNNFIQNQINAQGGPLVTTDSHNKMYFIKITDPTDPRFGTNNDDPIWGSAVSTTTPYKTEKADTTGYSYVYYKKKFGSNDDDKIRWYNQQIRLWKEALAHNEELKLSADSTYNLSIGGQTYYEQSMSVEVDKEWTSSFEFNVGGEITADFKADICGNGVESETSIGFEYTRNHTSVTDTTQTTTYGFVLNDPNIGDALSIDVKNDHSGNSPVFSLVAGSTMCPWEAADTVKYLSGHIGEVLSGATFRREKLEAEVSPGIPQMGIPYNQPAVYSLTLKNLSETQDAMTYYLRVLQESNPDGAIVKVNGVIIEDHLAFSIPGNTGQNTVNATLTVECGPVNFDYSGLKLLFYSPCEYETFQNNGFGYAFDTIPLEIHFTPPCKTMNITDPSDLFVVNSNNPDTLTLRLEGTASIWRYQHKVTIQQKLSTSSTWHDVVSFWRNSTLSDYVPGEPIFPENSSSVLFQWPVSNYPDGTYNIRVMGDCQVSSLSSPIITGVFDRVCPAPFGNPQPSDGILSSGDELSIQFNEPMDASSFNANSFDIRGVLNGTPILHGTSVEFDGIDGFMKMSGVNLASKSFAVEFWMKRDTSFAGTVQTIFSQGNDPNNCLVIGINGQNKLFLHLKDSTISTNTIVPADKNWYHWVVSFDKENNLVEFFKESTLLASIPLNIDYQEYSDVYVAKPTLPGYSYFNGYMHELRVWGKPLILTDFITNISSKLSGSESKLIGCWPMNEGNGTLISDIAHNRNATLTNGSWKITPSGTAFKFDNSSYAKMNTQTTVFTAQQDFSIEFWFKSSNGANVCLFSNGSGAAGSDIFNRNTWSIKSNDIGMLQIANNGIITNIASGYFDGNWHHFAMSVNRMGNLNVYLDGVFKAGSSAFQYSGFIANNSYLGTQATIVNDTANFSNFYTGSLDEVRIWSLWRTQDQVNRDMHFRLMGNETGLLHYYPFEKEYTQNGIKLLTPTLENVASVNSLTVIGNPSNWDSNDPKIKLEKSVSAVDFTYLLNNDKIIFTTTTPNAQIENCILDIMVKGIKDLHDNSMKSARTWTAYVDRNPLAWSSQEIILNKNIYDPLNFSVVLENKGGNAESYTIMNLPSWLSCSPQSGTINPSGTAVISFNVNSGLNIGKYIVDIAASSAFGYDETFVLKLDVIAPPPSWSVNPADFAYSMNLVGELAIDSILSSDKSDIIAAFSGNECRGVGSLQYIASVDKWEVFLDLYSNETSINQPLKFKVWDASEGVIRSEVVPVVNFVSDAVLGTIMQPVYINALKTQDQFIPLKPGWTWFSLNLTSPFITNINTVLQDVQGTTGDLVKAQVEYYAQYTAGSGWYGNFNSSNHFKNTQMYMIKVSNPDTIRFVGKIVDPTTTSITINSGWNWIGYVPQTNLTVNEAMASYLGAKNGDVIKGQSSFAMYQSGMDWNGSLHYMKPGEGYMYKSLDTTSKSFFYPATGTGLNKDLELPPVIPTAWNNNLDQYENSLSLVAKVQTGEWGSVNGDMVLGAFVNNVCRGYIKPTYVPTTNDYLFFLPVHSTMLSGENVTFKLYDPSFSVENQVIETIAFASNAVLGNIEHPIPLNILSSVNGIQTFVKTEDSFQISPNPFQQETVVSYGLKEDAHLTINVYNALGIKACTLIDKQMQKGLWKQSWNGTNESGVKLPAGMYYVEMKTSKFTSQIKVIIVNK